MSHISSISIKHVCSICFDPNKDVSACNRCHTTFYCSPGCQKLDWKKHKIFCVGEDKELSILRRNKCIEIIKKYSDCIFRYLIFSHVNRSDNSFLFVNHIKKPLYCALDEKRVLKKLGFTLSENTELALSLALTKTQEINKEVVDKEVEEELGCDDPEVAPRIDLKIKAITVLHIENLLSSVYILGSEEVRELSESVQKMPSELIMKCYYTFIDDKIDNMDYSEAKETISTMLDFYLDKNEEESSNDNTAD